MLEDQIEVETIEIMEKEISLAVRPVSGVYLVPLENNLCWMHFIVIKKGESVESCMAKTLWLCSILYKRFAGNRGILCI